MIVEPRTLGPASDAEYTIGTQDGKRTIFHLRYRDYMWHSDQSLHVSSNGGPTGTVGSGWSTACPDRW